MTYEDVKQHLDHRPFVPFTVQTDDGDRFSVVSPEFAFLHPKRTYLLIARNGESLPYDRFVDLAHITQIATDDGFNLARKIVQVSRTAAPRA